MTSAKKQLLTAEALQRALAIKDLSLGSDHAIGLMAREVIEGLARKGWPRAIELRGDRVVSAVDNYTALGYSDSEATLGS